MLEMTQLYSLHRFKTIHNSNKQNLTFVQNAAALREGFSALKYCVLMGKKKCIFQCRKFIVSVGPVSPGVGTNISGSFSPEAARLRPAGCLVSTCSNVKKATFRVCVRACVGADSRVVSHVLNALAVIS